MIEVITTSIEDERRIMADGENAIANRDDAWSPIYPGYASTGALVNEQTALTYSAVWGCVAVIVEAIGALGWHLYRRQPDGGRTLELTNPIERLISTRPNQDMSSQTFRETVHAHALLYGNGYAEIQRDQMNRPVALWPLSPASVTPVRTAAGDIVYLVRDVAGEPRPVLSLDMYHLHGLGFDGVQGYSVIKMAKQSIRLGRSMETFGTSWFENGSRPGGVLKHPNKLDQSAIDRLRSSWNAQQQGAGKAGGVAILEEGMDWSQMAIPPEDAQFLESRVFQIDEMCRWYRVPKVMLQNLADATLNNVEQMYMQFARGTVLPWATRWETEADYKLVDERDRPALYTALNLDSLQRANLEARNKSYATGRQWGWLSVDDIRRMENMNPLPNGAGQIYLVPANMMNAATMANGGAADGEAARQVTRAEADRLINAQAPVFTEAARRLIDKESKAARRAAVKHEADPQAFEAWAERFYPAHEKQWREAMRVPIEALVTLIAGFPMGVGTEDMIDTLIIVSAAQEVEQSRSDLAVAFASGEIAALCDQWESERPASITAELGEQATHVALLATIDEGTNDEDSA